MQASPSLAEFLARLDEGPRGADDALAAIDKCAADASPLLDLQQMELTDKDLQLIAPKFSALSSHVKELNLFMNEISVLPASIAALSELEVLHAGCNPLEKVEPELFPGLPKLVEVDIGYNELLTELPDTFDRLESLRVLLAGNGRLTSIPPSLFKCRTLEELYLYGNSLKDIGEGIGSLSNLRVLNVGRNQIARLPESIGKCSAMETLHLYENCLSCLPNGVTHLTNLKTLNILSNPEMPMLPQEVRRSAKATVTATFLAAGKVN